MAPESPEISIVIPVFNEEPNLRDLVRRTVAALETTGRTFELLIVDDGSSDGSFQALKQLREQDSRLRIVQLMRNFGQSAALYAGFAHVRGQIVCMMDADLQNPPEELPKLIAKIDEGYDFVNGYRAGRRDSKFRTLPSRLINFIVKRTTKAQFRDVGCAQKAFRREVIDMLARFSHRSRYLPVDVAWLGVRTAEVEVQHAERAAGVSKYGLLKLIRTTFDLVTSVTAAPLQAIAFVGIVAAVAGIAMGARVLYYRIVHGNDSQLGTVMAVMFVLTGTQLVATGIMCEYISRIYVEVQNRPYYVVKNILE